jgi:hypothetical protein
LFIFVVALLVLFRRGYGDNAALGTGRDEDEIFPALLKVQELSGKGRKCLQVQAGSQHSIILASRGKADPRPTET